MRIVGIDPGLRLTGYGCVEFTASGAAVREAGVLRFSARATLSARLLQLSHDLEALLAELEPDLLVVERVFSHVNHARTAIIMGHARGVVLLCGARRHLPLVEIAPAEVKKAVAGSGRATKEQMQAAVARQCGLPEIPEPPDVADALALALCAGRRGAIAADLEVIPPRAAPSTRG